MNAPLGMYPLERTTLSLQRREPLLGGSPAPVGSLFMLGEHGGYAAAPRPNHRLVLGRNNMDVHVVVGAGDWYVSREQAVVQCVPLGTGMTWTLRNVGRRPIRMPSSPLLLQEHEVVLQPGYTPLFIHGDRLHVLEVLVSAGRRESTVAPPNADTRDLGWPLKHRQRLVLTAMFQAFLRQDSPAHPLSASDTSKILNALPGQEGWTPSKVHHVVDEVRHELAAAGERGLTADSAHPEALRHNLIQVLLNSATLVPPDLRLLDADPAREPLLG
jgi:hypothetical protein